MKFKKRLQTIKFYTGEKTCAYEKGKFCQFLGTVPGSYGQAHQCNLFGVRVREDKPLGCLQRCTACLETFKN